MGRLYAQVPPNVPVRYLTSWPGFWKVSFDHLQRVSKETTFGKVQQGYSSSNRTKLFHHIQIICLNSPGRLGS
jgi:hypothetical protein